jgi:hypothetical protein
MNLRSTPFARVAAATAIITSLAASPALADWQKTQWGMTKQEVMVATGGIAEKPSNLHEVHQAGHPSPFQRSYATSEFNFEARYIFDSRGLSQVDLDLRQASEAKCARLHYVLQNAYGAPVEDDDGEVLHTSDWRDTANQNAVYYRLFKLTLTCSVNYQRLLKAGEPGGL